MGFPKEMSLTGKYGTWMLVSRKPRRNNGRNNSWSGQPRNMQYGSPRGKETMEGDQRLQSMFSALDGLDGNGMDQDQEMQTTPTEDRHPYESLPRIRTNYRGGHNH